MFHNLKLDDLLLDRLENFPNSLFLIGEAGHSVNPALPTLCQFIADLSLDKNEIVICLEHLSDINHPYDEISLYNEWRNGELNAIEFKMIHFLLNCPNIFVYGLEQKSPFTPDMNFDELCHQYRKLSLPSLDHPNTQAKIAQLLEDGTISDVRKYFNMRYAESLQRIQDFNIRALEIMRNIHKELPNSFFIAAVGAKHLPRITNSKNELQEPGMFERSIHYFDHPSSICVCDEGERFYIPKDAYGNQYGGIKACHVNNQSANDYVVQLPKVPLEENKDVNKKEESNMMDDFIASISSFFTFSSSKETKNPKDYKNDSQFDDQSEKKRRGPQDM